MVVGIRWEIMLSLPRSLPLSPSLPPPPFLPPSSQTYTLSGQQLKEVDVKEETVSEILRLYLLNKSGHSLQQV